MDIFVYDKQDELKNYICKDQKGIKYLFYVKNNTLFKVIKNEDNSFYKEFVIFSKKPQFEITYQVGEYWIRPIFDIQQQKNYFIAVDNNRVTNFTINKNYIKNWYKKLNNSTI